MEGDYKNETWEYQCYNNEIYKSLLGNVWDANDNREIIFSKLPNRPVIKLI